MSSLLREDEVGLKPCTLELVVLFLSKAFPLTPPKKSYRMLIRTSLFPGCDLCKAYFNVSDAVCDS